VKYDIRYRSYRAARMEALFEEGGEIRGVEEDTSCGRVFNRRC
jgi:hypothetical protein